MLSSAQRNLARKAFLATRAQFNYGIRSFNSVTVQDVDHFRDILSEPSSVLSTIASSPKVTASELDAFNTDWMGKYKGNATTVLKPRSTEEVSRIMKYCWEKRIAVVPQGGNTGLVGGSVPLNDEVVINLGSLSTVRFFDPVSGVLVADAGCVLESLSSHIASHGFIMPLDLGAKGSCQIGGNVATNAGGLRLLRYGPLHGSVLGLEVVLPDGTVLDQLSVLRKDNTGYDLKQLFIGSEGTLGIITAVSIQTPAAPRATNNIVLALPSFENVIPLFQTVRSHLSEILSAFEYFDRTAYELALKHGHQAPFSQSDSQEAACFVLIETSGGNQEHDEQKLTTLLETLMDAEPSLIITGTMSQSQPQFEALWRLREGITESIGKEGKAYKYDISIPIASFEDVVNTVRKRCEDYDLLKDGLVKMVLGFGHIGDGNLHLNIVASNYHQRVSDALEPFVYELVGDYFANFVGAYGQVKKFAASHQGSVSSEHGIGSMKIKAMKYSKDETSRQLMKKFKDLLDGRGIMNPGKVLE